MEPYLAWIFLILGVLSRVFVPFLLARRNDPSLSWSWRFIWPQLITVLVIFLVLPLLIADLSAVSGLAPAVAYLAGWAAADVGRETDKLLLRSPATTKRHQ
jgi:hypothetical protein